MNYLGIIASNITAVAFPFIAVFAVAVFSDHIIHAVKQVMMR